MRPLFCFVDDSAFELEVFAQNIVPAAPGIEFLLGSTYEDVRARLDERYPALFLLDLYGRDPNLSKAKIPPQAELAARIASFKTLASVYQGLDDFPGDRVNEYLKRLYDLCDSWRRLFYQASRAAGQNINYGLENLAAVRRDYPAAAAIGYTRKSLILDAVEVLAAGADGLSLKPHGPTDQAIHEATAAAAPRLLETWSETVTRNFTASLQGLALRLVRSGAADQVGHLTQPERLSPEARARLGPGQTAFLQTAAAWWEFTGRQPEL